MSKEKTISQIQKFLQEQSKDVKIDRVVSFEVIQDDGGYEEVASSIGDLQVECIVLVPNYSGTTNQEREENRTCIIDRDVFEKWRRNHNAVQWV